MEVKLINCEKISRCLEVWAGDELVQKIDKILFKKHLAQITKMTNIHQELEILEKKIAKSYLNYLLSRRAYSSFELTKKLKERSFSALSIDSALLASSDYIQDEELVTSIIRVEAAKGKGERAIVEKLVRRMGYSREDMRARVEDSYSAKQQGEKALFLVKKKYRRVEGYEQASKALRFLVGRGFSYQTAKEAVTKNQHDLDNEEME